MIDSSRPQELKADEAGAPPRIAPIFMSRNGGVMLALAVIMGIHGSNLSQSALAGNGAGQASQNSPKTPVKPNSDPPPIIFPLPPPPPPPPCCPTFHKDPDSSTDKTNKLPVLGEQYLAVVEAYNSALENYRLQIEELRQKGQIDLGKYQSLMGDYQDGIKTYRESIRQYRDRVRETNVLDKTQDANLDTAVPKFEQELRDYRSKLSMNRKVAQQTKAETVTPQQQ